MEEIRKTSWGWYFIPLFTGFYTSQVVQDFFHQQYCWLRSTSYILHVWMLLYYTYVYVIICIIKNCNMLQFIHRFENWKTWNHRTVYRHNIKDSCHRCFDISYIHPGKNPSLPLQNDFPTKMCSFLKTKSLFTVDIVNFPCNFPVQTLPFASGWGRLRTAGRLRWPGVTAVNTLTATKDHRSIIYLPKRWTCGSYGLARNFDKTSLEFWDKKNISGYWILLMKWNVKYGTE